MAENKILAELRQFQAFKQRFVFKPLTIEDASGLLQCEGFALYDAENKLVGECEKWINIGIMIKSPLSRILSNLYPYEFEFRGFQLKSIEGFFQGVKFKNPEMQKLVFSYSGYNAYCLKAASDYRWQDEGNVYFQGEPIRREGKEYADIVDELYISAAQNPLFRQALKNVQKPLIHSIGKTDKNETLLTRYEYEAKINALVAFLKGLDH